jgi:hypothetical protein
VNREPKDNERRVLSPPVNEGDRLRDLERSVALVRDRVAQAARRSGRRDDEVRVIGVTKGVAGEVVAAAVRAGLGEFGENYVQELETKRPRAPDAIWHFVGRLQRNKAHRVLRAVEVVHTLEPGAAADRLARLAEERPVDCLVEVDFTGRRVGVGPQEAEGFAERMAESRGIRVRGLMTVAPQGEDPRRAFAALRELRDRLRGRLEDAGELSMGMSADLEAAVEEGATMVRVGTAIFGPREV